MIAAPSAGCECRLERARVVRCDDEPVEPGMGQTRSVSSAQMRAKLIGTPFADFIRASGYERRVNRPDT